MCSSPASILTLLASLSRYNLGILSLDFRLVIKEEFPVMFAHPRDSRGGPTGQTDLPSIKVVMEGAEKK